MGKLMSQDLLRRKKMLQGCLKKGTLLFAEGMQGNTEPSWGGRRLAVSLTDKPDTPQVTPSVQKQCGWASFPDIPEQLCEGSSLPPLLCLMPRE